MAAAVVIAVPAIFKIKELLGAAVLSESFNEQDLMTLIAEYTHPGAAAESVQPIGGGYYSSNSGLLYNNTSLSTGIADHLYIVYPNSVVRSLAVVKTVSTITSAPTNTVQNNRWQVNDSAADFSTVLPGDIVVLTTTGATATIESVDAANDSLETTNLNYNQKFNVGTSYYVCRAPGTDTSALHDVEGYWVNSRGLELKFWQRLLSSRSQQVSRTTDMASSSPELSVQNIKLRIEYLRGVIGG